MRFPYSMGVRPLRLPMPLPHSERLMLYLPMDENAVVKAQVRDLSRFGRHGTLNGATLVRGKYGQALKFNGVSDYLDTGYAFTIGASEAWTFLVNMRAQPGADGVFMGVGRNWNSYWNRLQLNFSGDKARAYVRDDDYNLIANITGSVTIADGEDHVIALIVGPVDNEVRLYVDGEADGVGSAAFSSFDTGDFTLHYGCLNNDGVLSGWADLEIDEARILARRLSVAEIVDHAHGIVRR